MVLLKPSITDLYRPASCGWSQPCPATDVLQQADATHLLHGLGVGVQGLSQSFFQPDVQCSSFSSPAQSVGQSLGRCGRGRTGFGGHGDVDGELDILTLFKREISKSDQMECSCEVNVRDEADLEVVVCERGPALGDGLSELGHGLGDLGGVVVLNKPAGGAISSSSKAQSNHGIDYETHRLGLVDLGDPESTQLGSARQDLHSASAYCTPDSLEHPLVQIIERVNPSLEGFVLGGKSVTDRMIQIRRSERNDDQSTEPRNQLAYRWKRPGDSLGHIVGVHLSEPLPGGLDGILEVLVDPREVDRGDGRSEGGLNGFPAEDVDVKGTSEPRCR